MHVTVNGEARDVPESVTLVGLMESLGLKPELTAVQRTDDIVGRDEHAATIPLQGGAISHIRSVVCRS